MIRLELYLLGTFRATLDGAPITTFGYDKVRALLVYLAVENDRPHQRERLAGLLWPEHPERTARLNLSQALSRLRRVLDDQRARPSFIDVTRQMLQFDPASNHWLDAVAFTQALDACAKHGHIALESCEECLERLEGAVALYRGPFLEGFSIPDSSGYEEWVLLHREQLHRLAQETLGRLAEAYAARGEYERGLAHAWRQVELDPWREAAQRGLMRLLALSGQRGAALAQYEECRRLLAEELGVEPGAETTALYARIRDGQVGPPQPSSIEALLEPLPSHNLPAPPNPFIGRAQQLADLLALISDPAVRLVTVVGPGGIGKTRLALQAGTEALDRFPEGVWLADLARVISPDAVPLVVASALGAQPQPNRDLTDTLVDSLQTRELLLLLDNCEHVLGVAAPLAGQLLSRCAGLTLLATSREALRVPGEQLFQALPMKLPALGDALDRLLAIEAVQLFLARAQAVRPRFALTEENARSIIDICLRLDGIPLAIELAAVRTRALAPQEIAARLDDRFRLLTAGGRTVPQRQQTLHNTVAWSYELLDCPERAFFDRLAVFRSGFTLKAAERVCAGDGVESDDVLDLLASLVDKSLVIAEQTNGGTTRYRLLETLRQFGAQQLSARNKAETLQLRHARYFMDWVEELEPLLDAWEDWAQVYKQLDPESDNLAAVMRWSLGHDQAEIALRIGGALKWWLVACPQFNQYVAWLRRALHDSPDVAPCLRAKALHAVNLYGWEYVLFDEASARLAEEELAAAEQAQEPDLVAQALVSMGRIAMFTGPQAHARALFQQSLDIGREMGSRPRIVHALAHIAQLEEQYQALDMLHALLPETPRSWRCFVYNRLAEANLQAGNLSEAACCFQMSLELVSELGRPSLKAGFLTMLGTIAMLQGNYDSAEQLLRRSCELARRCGSMNMLVDALNVAGETAWYRGNVTMAEARWTDVLSLAQLHTGPWDAGIIYLRLSTTACIAGDFDRAEAFCQKSDEGLPRGNVYASGLVKQARARIALFRGDAGRAAALYQRSLYDLNLFRANISMLRTLEGLAWAWAAMGSYEKAAQLLSALAVERERSGMVLPPVEQPHHERAWAEALDGLGEEAFAAAWDVGAALTLEEAVALALS